jgi:hypothetical protein
MAVNEKNLKKNIHIGGLPNLVIETAKNCCCEHEPVMDILGLLTKTTRKTKSLNNQSKFIL